MMVRDATASYYTLYDHMAVAGTFTITWPHLFRATAACNNIVRVAQHPMAFSSIGSIRLFLPHVYLCYTA